MALIHLKMLFTDRKNYHLTFKNVIIIYNASLMWEGRQ